MVWRCPEWRKQVTNANISHSCKDDRVLVRGGDGDTYGDYGMP